MERAAWGLVAVAAILSCIAGFAVGRFVGGGGNYALILAGLGIVATVATTLGVAILNSSATLAAESRAERRRNSKQFGRHSIELNEHVFKFMVSVRIEYPLERNPPIHPAGFGLVVPHPSSPQPIGIAGLANWPYGLAHFLANLEVKARWDGALAILSKFYSARDSNLAVLTDALTSRIREEFGEEMGLTGHVGDPPPWVDVEGVSWFAMAKRESGYQQFYATPNPDPPAGSLGPYFVSWGTGSFLCGRSRAEADPSRLQRVFDDVTDTDEIAAGLNNLIALARDTVTAVSALGETFRVYSNRIQLAHTFEGSCDICRIWVPR